MTRCENDLNEIADLLQPVGRDDSKPLHKHCDGDADTEPISWETAQDEASRWLGSLRLGRSAWDAPLGTLRLGREMVMEAARRKLENYGSVKSRAMAATRDGCRARK